MNSLARQRAVARTILVATALCADMAARAEEYFQVQEFQSTVVAARAGTGIDMDDLSVVLHYDLFNPAWGTLVGAHWTLLSRLDGFAGGSVYSTSTDPNAQQSGSLRASSAAGAQALRGTASYGNIIGQFFGQDSCTTTLAGGPCGLFVDLSGFVDGVVQADHLSELIGLGSFTQSVFNYTVIENMPALDGFSVPYMTASSTVNLADDPQRYGFGKLVLSYDYVPATPVPEPSTLSLLSLGVLTISYLRRRRRG